MDITTAINGEVELIEKYKKKLKIESFEMFLNLSPGVRLKAIMDQEENREKDRTIDLKPRKIQNILPKLSEDKSKTRKYQSKSGEKWNTIYELFELKRKEYKDQWKDHVIAKALESRYRVDHFQKIDRGDIPLWGSKKVSKKKIEISKPTKNDRIYEQKREREKRTQNVEKTVSNKVVEKSIHLTVAKKKSVAKVNITNVACISR